jgi:carbamate kinase
VSNRTAVVAIGGNALVPDNQHGSIADQFVAAGRISREIAAMVGHGWTVVVTHGNGPQAGFILRRSDIVARIDTNIPRIGLDVAVADSQGGIGYIVSGALTNELRAAGVERTVVAVITHTVVDEGDPAFTHPTKPIGSWFNPEEARDLQAREGWAMVEDSGRGWRRVVASPRPKRIVELEAVAALVRQGFIVIAAGGGGIPVVEEPGGGFRGVEAVIDKDFASALLAAGIGADLFVITTGVPQVAVNFGKPDQRFLDRMTLEEAERHLKEGQFPPGSMGPKIEAALDYLRAGGGEVLITSTDRLAAALEGVTGTRLVGTVRAGKGERN